MGTIVKRRQRDWDLYFMGIAQLTAKMSKDPDRKVGAVLVSADRRQLSIGYNGLPADVPDDLEILMNRELKLQRMVHAERNCLRQAPFTTAGCTLYVTRPPCQDCAALIVEAGVKRVVGPRPDLNHPRWGLSWREAQRQFSLRGIEYARMGILK